MKIIVILSGVTKEEEHEKVLKLCKEPPDLEYRYFPSLERAIRFVNTGIP